MLLKTILITRKHSLRARAGPSELSADVKIDMMHGGKRHLCMRRRLRKRKRQHSQREVIGESVCVCVKPVCLVLFVASGTFNRDNDHRETDLTVPTAGHTTCNHKAIQRDTRGLNCPKRTFLGSPVPLQQMQLAGWYIVAA